LDSRFSIDDLRLEEDLSPASNRKSTIENRKHPRQESNLILDLRRVVCGPAHPEDIGDF